MKKEKEYYHEKGKKIIGLFFAAFIIYNAVWGFYVYNTYKPLKESIGTSLFASDCGVNEDGYTYGVKAPAYLTFVGNLSVSQDIAVEEDGSSNDSVDLIIWPQGKDGYEYEVSVHYSYYDKGADDYFVDDVNVVLDEHLMPLESYDDRTMEIINEKQSDIKKIMDLANNKWTLNETKKDI